MQKLSSEQSAKGICRFDRLRTAHLATVLVVDNVSETHMSPLAK